MQPENFALVRKPSSAVEKAAPRAKKILSGITADALLLAKQKESLKIVVIDDEPNLLEMFGLLIRERFKNAKLFQFENSREAWLELSRENPDILITRDKMPGMTGEEIARRLLSKKINYPIIITGGWTPTEEWVRNYAGQGLNISFLQMPFINQDFQKLLTSILKVH